jgi:endonuclease G
MRRKKNNVGVVFVVALLMGVTALCAHKTEKQDKETVLTEEKSDRATEDVDGSDANDAENREADDANSGNKSAVEDVSALEVPAYGKNEEVIRRLAYTLSYNHETRLPNWVAWHLTANHVDGPVKRKDVDFTDDESVAAPKGCKSDYYSSGYDRGHMCPAGDNKWSERAMQECFLMTNMCPQLAGLNSGMWNSLEKNCRTWAEQYGDVYIVCGPVLLKGAHKTIGRNKVVVPEAFFKVILCTKGKPKAIGFVMRNQSMRGHKKTEFVNSVDDVERITGIDFFPALPDDIENEVEKQSNPADWN